MMMYKQQHVLFCGNLCDYLLSLCSSCYCLLKWELNPTVHGVTLDQSVHSSVHSQTNHYVSLGKWTYKV